MGYDLHITRAEHWMINRGREIPAAEWLAVAEADRELTTDPENGPYAVVWKGGKGSGWFDWFDGNVFTTNPTRAAVAKLLILAKRLRGTVQGDGGENYRTPREWKIPDR